MTKQEYLYNWIIDYFIPIIHLIIAIEDYEDETNDLPYTILHERYLDAAEIFDTLTIKKDDENTQYSEQDMNAALSTYIAVLYNEEISLLLRNLQNAIDKSGVVSYDVCSNYTRLLKMNFENTAFEMIKDLRKKEENNITCGS